MGLRLVEVAHLSDTGRVRSHNEDRYLASPPLLVVADGMGGAKAGEVAAQMTVDALSGLGNHPSATTVVEAIAEANRAIRALSSSDSEHAGMGTTVTAALILDDRPVLLHVGDSRGYLLSDGTLTQITADHSLVAEMVRQGQLTPEDAARHPSRNIITRALGAEPDVTVDQFPLDLADGDILLVCSDGLSSLVNEDDIRRIIVAGSTLDDTARRLVDAALAAGGTDNITVLLGRVGHTAASIDETAPLAAVSSPASMADTETEPTTELRADNPDLTAARAEIPAPPVASPKPDRRPAVLEDTARSRRTLLRRGAGIGTIVIACLSALAVWAGSRAYFVSAEDGASTVRVYRGAPIEIAGVELFGEWGDTGVDAAAVRTADAGALDRSAHGQGVTTQRAVDLVWRHGLTAVTPIVAPPPPTPARRTPAR